METACVSRLLSEFARCPRCFSVREFIDSADSDIACVSIWQRIATDRRFVFLGEQELKCQLFIPYDELLISASTLFRWYARLSVRLADARTRTLSGRQFANLLSLLRQTGRWRQAPDAAIAFGQEYGFISDDKKSGRFLFPLAHSIGFIPLPAAPQIRLILESLADPTLRARLLEQPAGSFVDQALSKLDRRTRTIIIGRCFSPSPEPRTLMEIGRRVRLTRERVRQIEHGFLSQISARPRACVSLVCGFLCSLMRNRGRLVLNNPTAIELALARFVRVPYARVHFTHLIILGADQSVVSSTIAERRWRSLVDKTKMRQLLVDASQLDVSRCDLESITQEVQDGLLEVLSKEKLVYLALLSFGRPAHYSEVTRRFAALFPHRTTTEKNVHAVLNRERHGVVWVGAKGMFALKKWGFTRPSKPLFKAVTDAVTQRYELTGKPVPLLVIEAEIQRQRRILNRNSLLFAITFNSEIIQNGKDCYVPAVAAPSRSAETIQEDLLNRVLEHFEATLRGKADHEQAAEGLKNG